ncbi:MAG: hypothetical protein R3C30_07355 [Hyphomonadaceae bacterium]
MAIVLRHHDKLELSRVEYFGVIRAQDLHDHAAFNAAHPVWLGFDCVSVIHGNVDVSGLSVPSLDGVFTAHRELFEPLNLMFMRRSAWVCENPDGQRFLSHWLTKRNADKSPWADVRQFESCSAAGEWMLLSTEDCATLASGAGFREVARFEAPSVAR